MTAQPAEAAPLSIGFPGCGTTIQQCIDNAAPGQTIVIQPSRRLASLTAPSCCQAEATSASWSRRTAAIPSPATARTRGSAATSGGSGNVSDVDAVPSSANARPCCDADAPPYISGA